MLQQLNLEVGEEAKLRGFLFKRLPPETIESLKKEIARLEQIIKSQDETLKDVVTTLLHRFGISEQSLVSENTCSKKKFVFWQEDMPLIGGVSLSGDVLPKVVRDDSELYREIMSLDINETKTLPGTPNFKITRSE